MSRDIFRKGGKREKGRQQRKYNKKQREIRKRKMSDK